MARWLVSVTAGVAAVLASLLGTAAVVDAGGSWLYPVQDRYEAGDHVTMVGYTSGGQYGWVEDGPFYATYHRMEDDMSRPDPEGVHYDAGELQVSVASYQARAEATFSVARDMAPGIYFLNYCNLLCDEQLGDLIGGVFYVGVDPEYPPVRGWPIDEPRLELLADEGLITIYGREARMGDVRAGRVSPPSRR